MELLYVLLGVGALVAIMESMSGSSDDGDLDSRPAEEDTLSGPADPQEPGTRDLLADPEDPTGPEDADTLPVTEFDPDSLPAGVAFAQSDDPQSPQFQLTIDDAEPESILLQGGILQLDSPHFDPAAFEAQALVFHTSEADAVIESLFMNEDNALVIQHPDAEAPLIIAGGDFTMIDARLASADPRATGGDIQL